VFTTTRISSTFSSAHFGVTDALREAGASYSAQVELARKFLALCRPTGSSRFSITALAGVIEDCCGANVSYEAIFAAARGMGLHAEPVTEISHGRVGIHRGDVFLAAEVLRELARERGLDVSENVWFGWYHERQLDRFARHHRTALESLLDRACGMASGHSGWVRKGSTAARTNRKV
jgi:hypothetical protein